MRVRLPTVQSAMLRASETLHFALPPGLAFWAGPCRFCEGLARLRCLTRIRAMNQSAFVRRLTTILILVACGFSSPSVQRHGTDCHPQRAGHVDGNDLQPSIRQPHPPERLAGSSPAHE